MSNFLVTQMINELLRKHRVLPIKIIIRKIIYVCQRRAVGGLLLQFGVYDCRSPNHRRSFLKFDAQNALEKIEFKESFNFYPSSTGT